MTNRGKPAATAVEECIREKGPKSRHHALPKGCSGSDLAVNGLGASRLLLGEEQSKTAARSAFRP